MDKQRIGSQCHLQGFKERGQEPHPQLNIIVYSNSNCRPDNNCLPQRAEVRQLISKYRRLQLLLSHLRHLQRRQGGRTVATLPGTLDQVNLQVRVRQTIPKTISHLLQL